MKKRIFFASNRKAAISYLKRVSQHEDIKPNMSSLKLSKKQIPHINNWKTWSFEWRVK